MSLGSGDTGVVDRLRPARTHTSVLNDFYCVYGGTSPSDSPCPSTPTHPAPGHVDDKDGVVRGGRLLAGGEETPSPTGDGSPALRGSRHVYTRPSRRGRAGPGWGWGGLSWSEEEVSKGAVGQWYHCR